MIEELLLKKGIDEEKAAKMESYARKLVEANKTMNLTRITEPEEMAEKHFLDSILPCTLGLIAPGQSIVDVGTGAGFPGVPLAIMEPEAHFTLMDSVQKKLEFVHNAVDNLCSNVDILWIRAEEAAHIDQYREKFDLCVTRAVAYLPKLLELTAGLVRVGGKILAYKGTEIMEELENSRNALGKLNLKLVDIYQNPLVDNFHVLAVFEKKGSLQTQYPRKFSKIKAAPL